MLSEYEWQAIILSLKVSAVAVLVSLSLGILIAWILVRCHFSGKTLRDSLIYLLLILPLVVVGYLLLLSFGRHGVIGEWLYNWFGFSFTFSWLGVALVSAITTFPF